MPPSSYLLPPTIGRPHPTGARADDAGNAGRGRGARGRRRLRGETGLPSRAPAWPGRYMTGPRAAPGRSLRSSGRHARGAGHDLAPTGERAPGSPAAR
eukprot:scaffold7560_cov390-Prasinococcus_capsulatus_cf.AAC.1